MPRKNAIALRELLPAEIPGIFPLIHLHNPGISKALFTKRLKAMMPLGYRAVAAFNGERMVGISGFWIGMRFWCGKQFDIDNFFVHPECRNQRIGEKLAVWLEKKALAEGCELIVLDTYADSFLAQRFYHRLGYSATGYHFTKIPGSRVPFSRRKD